MMSGAKAMYNEAVKALEELEKGRMKAGWMHEIIRVFRTTTRLLSPVGL